VDVQIYGFGSLALTFLTGAAGGLALIGLAPAKLGEKLFGHYLDRKLADLRHVHEQQIAHLKADQDRQLEEFRSKLAHVGDRGVRSNEKEFQAVVAAWESFLVAYSATMQCAIAAKEYPNLDGLPEPDIRRYLETTDLSEMQREKVMEAGCAKNQTLARILDAKDIYAAGLAIQSARKVIGNQSIFIPDDLLALFNTTIQHLFDAYIQRYMEPNYGAFSDRMKSVENLIMTGERQRQALLNAVRARIFRHELP
jgi:hypothetical protein